MIEMVKSVAGCQFMHVIYSCEVKEIGKKMQAEIGGVVTKRVDTQVQFNYSYENAVKNRLKKDGKESNFVAQSLPWGEWLIPNKVITNKGVNYLRVYQYDGAPYSATFFVGGEVATDEQVAQIKAILAAKVRPVSETQKAAGLEEHQVKPNVIKCSGIEWFAMDGQMFSKEETTKIAM